MGKIKPRIVKKAGIALIKKGIIFNDSFENNKKILGNTMPSKKLRNKMAGFLARLKTQEKIKQLELANILNKKTQSI